ncbi:MAG: CRISPR-associated endonuclease Cas3'', partial [Betaproteobacteria bacterium]|nr:CRISPR-associated endonuclease Cas3'' [Betaproteobacteria bacterium]
MEDISNGQNNQQEVFYAHTPRPGSRIWHELGEHLLGTGKGAGNFAEFFGAKDIAYLLGVWHDLGKFNPKFRSYLIAQYEGNYHPSEPHAIWGAALAYKLFLNSARWHEIAMPILGHHAGLHDQGDAENKLRSFLDQNPRALDIMRSNLQKLKVKMPTLKMPEQNPHQRELFVRMIFSALVDADYLDTEKHFDPNQAKQRKSPPTICSLWHTLESAQQKILNESTVVNRIRKQVYESCLNAATLKPGLFRLTVPTGGGKTRSGLAFALRHALKNDLFRVIVAIPYTSITTQTAQTYRDIFGDGALLEHHSAIPLQDDKNDRQDTDYLRRKLASENWDASLIITTTVQLFESLFSNRPSKVRKLHRLARSVIILDEVQTLPLELLAPTLDVLKILSTPIECGGYGASIVLCTATQPAFEESRWLDAFQGAEIREIVPDYPRHFAELAQIGRVEYSVRSEMTWKVLADEIRTKSQVLVVLNTRKDALALLKSLDDTADVFHLSTLLCGAHRQAVLAEVKTRLDLDNPRPVRLISTQVVEAGVDIDFPEVWR